MILRVVPLIMAASALTAQTVGTAFRTVSLTPDEIVVEMLVATPTDTMVEQATALLSPLRITPQDLKSVGTLRDSPDRLGWQYSFVRPYSALYDVVKQLEQTRRQLRDKEHPLSYQFFFRASPRTLDATKRRVLAELLAEARKNAGSGSKLRSVTIEPTPETIDAGRPALLFGQPSGALQYTFSVIAVFENE